jgi:BolA protein
MNNEQRIQGIKQRLQQNLVPTRLEVEDESHLHIGHPGAQSGAGHFAVTIASPFFAGKSKIKCHRLIYTAVIDLMGDHIHALKINIVSEE